MKRLDFLVIGIAVLLSLLPLPLLAVGRAQGGVVVVSVRGEVLYEGPLSKDAVIVTPDGKNVVEIAGGEARMQSAACPDQLCVASGAASVLRPLVCLPNGVTVTIRAAAKKEAPDALTY